ncbi:Uncharacterized protein TCM_032523 [Theobroma cacao]|uniref:Uncharacterized protein n=1 Tax=Theobroma cacao TaxID=3641 RepID=A0A061FAV3_THECC|nr:Uncharacterized protein TCM_032523 [Theobroma cacao]
MAWTEGIGVPTSTRTHVYEFGTRVLALRLLATSATSKSTCGLPPTPLPLTPVPKPKGYSDMVIDVKDLKTSFNRLSYLFMEVIVSRRLLDAFRLSSSH